MRLLPLLFLFSSLAVAAEAAEPAGERLAYAPAPPDNPLKGFVPYLRACACLEAQDAGRLRQQSPPTGALIHGYGVSTANNRE